MRKKIDRGLVINGPRPRYDSSRKIGREKRRHVQETGQPRDTEELVWNNLMHDDYLEGVLVEGLAPYHPDPTHPSMETKMGRSWRSIDTNYWKLGACYENRWDYRPQNRTDRTGRPWINRRELHLVQYAVSKKGVENHAYRLDYLSRILGRSKKDIRGWFRKIFDDRLRAGFKMRADGEELPSSTWMDMVLAVRAHLKRFRFGSFPRGTKETSRRRPVPRNR